MPGFLASLLFLGTALGQGDPVKELQPRLFNLNQGEIPLSEALQQLQKQTGNIVFDRRKDPFNPQLNLALKNVTFWEALDTIVHQAKCGYSVYQEDGKLALIDAPLRQMPVHYSGIFRVAARRVSVTRDEESASHFCTVALEIAWEPRFQPFYLDVGAMQASFAPAGQQPPLHGKAAGQGKVQVAGRSSFEVEVRLPAPPRSSPTLASLEGKFSLLGPSKMLTFSFPKLKAGEKSKQTLEDVQVSVTPLPPQTNRWSFDVNVVNPPGGPPLESYQEGIWIFNNRIFLERTLAGKTEVISPLPDEFEDLEPLTPTRASLRYHFTQNLPTSLTGWSLAYRTPGRLIEVPLPISLKNIPLP